MAEFSKCSKPNATLPMSTRAQHKKLASYNGCSCKLCDRCFAVSNELKDKNKDMLCQIAGLHYCLDDAHHEIQRLRDENKELKANNVNLHLELKANNLKRKYANDMIAIVINDSDTETEGEQLPVPTDMEMLQEVVDEYVPRTPMAPKKKKRVIVPESCSPKPRHPIFSLSLLSSTPPPPPFKPIAFTHASTPASTPTPKPKLTRGFKMVQVIDTPHTGGEDCPVCALDATAIADGEMSPLKL